MSHRFTFTVNVEVTRTSGKFASRDEIAEALIEEIEGADPSSIYNLGADGESEYEIDSWEVEEIPDPAKAKGNR